MLNKKKKLSKSQQEQALFGTALNVVLGGRDSKQNLSYSSFLSASQWHYLCTAVTACMLVPVSYFTKYFNKPQNICSYICFLKNFKEATGA